MKPLIRCTTAVVYTGAHTIMGDWGQQADGRPQLRLRAPLNDGRACARKREASYRTLDTARRWTNQAVLMHCSRAIVYFGNSMISKNATTLVLLQYLYIHMR